MSHADYSELIEILNNNKDDDDLEECIKTCKRTVYFVENFRKQLIEKLSDYEKEADGDVVKLNKRTEAYKYILMGIGGVAGGALTYKLAGNLNGIKSGMDGASHSEKLLKYVDNHKDKATKVTLKIQEIFNDPQIDKVIIRIAVKIIIMYEEQFMKLFDDKEWLKNRSNLIKDGIKRIISFIEEEKYDKQNQFEDIVLEAFSCDYSQERNIFPTIIKKGNRMLKKSPPWTFTRINKKVGIAIRKHNNKKSVYYWPKSDPPKFGFKIKIPNSNVDNKFIEEEAEYKGRVVHYDHFLDYKMLDEIVDAIQKIRRNFVTGDSKDIHREVIDISNKLDNKDKGDKEMKLQEYLTSSVLPPIANFTGRADKIAKIYEMLNKSRSVKSGRIRQTVCISGSALMGKSELVRAFIEKHGEEYENIFWINANNLQQKNYMHLYEECKKEKNKKSLFVFDDATSFEELEPALPKQRLEFADILITSRSKNWDAGQEGQIDILELLTFDEAFEFVSKHLPEEKKEDIDALIETLDGLPLLLQQAVSIITKKQQKIKLLNKDEKYTALNFIEEFKNNSKQFLNKEFGAKSRNLKPVYTTWNITIEHIRKNDEHGEEAINLLRIISYLDSIFDVEMLSKGDEEKEEAIILLNQYSLINLCEGQADVHKVVQEVIRLQIEDVNGEEDVLKQFLSLKWDSEFCYFHLTFALPHLQKHPQLLKEHCETNKIPFQVLFDFDCYEVIEELLKYVNWDDEKVQKKFHNIVYEAVCFSSEEIVELVFKNGNIKLPEDDLQSLSLAAAKNGNLKILELLNANHANKNGLKLIALIARVESKETFEIFKQFLLRDDVQNLLSCSSSTQIEVLKKTIKSVKKYKGVVKLLLENGVCALTTQKGMPFLIHAIKHKNKHAVEELLTFREYSTNVYFKDKSAFYYACVWGTKKIVNALLEAGFDAEPNIIFYMPYYPECELKILEFLVEKKLVDIQMKDALKRTALFSAILGKQKTFIKYFIENGLSIHECDALGHNLLHYATALCEEDLTSFHKNSDKEYCELLHGHLKDKKDYYSEYLRSNVYEIVKLLLKNGIDASKRDLKNRTALFFAAYHSHPKTIKILVEAMLMGGAGINDCDFEGRTPLHYALMYENYNFIQEIIKKSSSGLEFSNINEDLYFETLPQYFSKIRKTINVLLKLGADVNVRDKFGCTPFHYVCAFGCFCRCSELLNNNNNNLLLKDLCENTPLHFAAISDNDCLLSSLISENKRLNINVVNNRKQNLLHYLAIGKCKNDELFNALIERGVDVNAPDSFNHLPLYYAHHQVPPTRNIVKIVHLRLQ